jgi:Flp pilus assembly protein TadD
MGKRRSRWRRNRDTQSNEHPALARMSGTTPDDDERRHEDARTDAHDDPANEGDSHALSQPAEEMVSDLRAAIGAFEIASPIEHSPPDESDGESALEDWDPDSESDGFTGEHVAADVEDPPIVTVADDESPLVEVKGPPPDDDAPQRASGEQPTSEDDVPDSSGDSGLVVEHTVIEEVVEVVEVVAAEEVTEAGEQSEESPESEEEEAEPPPPRDMVLEAQQLAEAGDRVQAVSQLKGIVAQSPGDSRARLALSEILDRYGDSEGALAVVDAGIEREPDDATLLVQRASLHVSRNRLESAEIDLRRALRSEEKNVEALTMLGHVCTRRGRWREAVEPLKAAADLAPDRAQIHYYLGEALNRLDRLQEALAAYETAAALNPANWRAHKGVGIVLDRLSRPHDAAEAYRRAR